MNIEKVINQHISKKNILSDERISELLGFLRKNSDIKKLPEFLIDALEHSNDILLTNSIALLMEDTNMEVYRKPLLEKYFSTPYGYRGTLLFACSSFDNSEDSKKILAFVVRTNLSDEELMVIPRLFKNMKKIEKTTKARMIKYIDSKMFDIDSNIADIIIKSLPAGGISD